MYILFKNKILKSWRVITIKGLVTTILGLLSFYVPIEYIALLIRIFGTLLIVSGAIMIYDFLIIPSAADRNWRVIEGTIDGFFGFITLILGLVTPSNFFIVVTLWISIIGLMQISNAYRLRSLFHHWKILMLNGFLALVFSIGIIIYPRESFFNKAIIMFLLSLVFVVFLFISSFYLKKLVEDIYLDIPHKRGEEGNQELSYY
jgi:uncharacterized membrane protein HdeD (DUF308 family)